MKHHTWFILIFFSIAIVGSGIVSSCGNNGNGGSHTKSSSSNSIQSAPISLSPPTPPSGQVSLKGNTSEQSYPSCASPQVKRCYKFKIGEFPEPEERDENSIKLSLDKIYFPDGPAFSPNNDSCKDTIKLDALYDVKPVDDLRNDHGEHSSRPDIYLDYEELVYTNPITSIPGKVQIPPLSFPYYGYEGSQPRIPILISPLWNGATPTTSLAADGIYKVEVDAMAYRQNKKGKLKIIGVAPSATSCIVLDNTKPTISIMNPKDGEQLSINKPTIQIGYADTLSGVDLSTFYVTITHNGQPTDITNRFNLGVENYQKGDEDGDDEHDEEEMSPSCSGTSYTFGDALEDGKYILNASIKDLACNPTQTTSTFYVCTNPPATPTITTTGDWFSEGTISNVCATTTSTNISAALLYINSTYASMQGSIPDPSSGTEVCFNNVSLPPGLLKAGANSITITVVNNVGCRTTASGSVILHPMIKKIIPSSATPGSKVMILGDGFDAFDPTGNSGENYVMIGDEKIPLFDNNGNPLYTLSLNVSNPPDDPSNTPTIYDELTITIPQDAETGLVIVVVNGVASGILNPQSNALTICKVPPDKVVSQVAGVGIGVQLGHQPNGSPATVALSDFSLSTSTDSEWKYGLEYTAWNSSTNAWEQTEITQVSNIPHSSTINKFSLYIGNGVTVATWTSYNSSTHYYELYTGYKWGSDGWVIQQVDSNVLNKKLSITYDPSRSATLIAYVSGSDGGLKLAHIEPGAGLIIDNIETPSDYPGLGGTLSIDGDVDLKISPQGNPVIGYMKGIQTSLLKTFVSVLSVATGTFNSTTKQYQWTIEVPQINGNDVSGSNPSIGFCANTQICISIGAVFRALEYWLPYTYSISFIYKANDNTWHSVAMENREIQNMAYNSITELQPSDVYYLYGVETSLQTDVRGMPRISYNDPEKRTLNYMWAEPKQWCITIPIIDPTTGKISSYQLCVPILQWYKETVDAGIMKGQLGMYNDLELDSLGSGDIAYYDNYNRVVYFYQHSNGEAVTPDPNTPAITPACYADAFGKQTIPASSITDKWNSYTNLDLSNIIILANQLANDSDSTTRLILTLLRNDETNLTSGLLTIRGLNDTDLINDTILHIIIHNIRADFTQYPNKLTINIPYQINGTERNFGIEITSVTINNRQYPYAIKFISNNNTSLYMTLLQPLVPWRIIGHGSLNGTDPCGNTSPSDCELFYWWLSQGGADPTINVLFNDYFYPEIATLLGTELGRIYPQEINPGGCLANALAPNGNPLQYNLSTIITNCSSLIPLSQLYNGLHDLFETKLPIPLNPPIEFRTRAGSFVLQGYSMTLYNAHISPFDGGIQNNNVVPTYQGGLKTTFSLKIATKLEWTNLDVTCHLDSDNLSLSAYLQPNISPQSRAYINLITSGTDHSGSVNLYGNSDAETYTCQGASSLADDFFGWNIFGNVNAITGQANVSLNNILASELNLLVNPPLEGLSLPGDFGFDSVLLEQDYMSLYYRDLSKLK